MGNPISTLTGLVALASGLIFLSSCEDSTGPGRRPATVGINGLGLADSVLEPGEEPYLDGKIFANGPIDTLIFKVLPIGRPADNWDLSGGLYVGFQAGPVSDTSYDLRENKVRLISSSITRPGAYRVFAYAYSGNASDTDSVDVMVGGAHSVYGWMQPEGELTGGDSVKINGRIFAKTPLLDVAYALTQSGTTIAAPDGLTLRHNPLAPSLTLFDVAGDGDVRLVAPDTLDYCLCVLTLTFRTAEETKAISATFTLKPKLATLQFDVPSKIRLGDTALITGRIQSPPGLDDLEFWITRTGTDARTLDGFTIVSNPGFVDKRTWDFQTDGGMRLVVASGATIGFYMLNVGIKSGKHQAFAAGKAFKVVAAAP